MDWREAVKPEVLKKLNGFDSRTLDVFQKAVPLDKTPCLEQFEDKDDLLAGWLVHLFIKRIANRNHLNYFRRVLELKPLIPQVGVCVKTAVNG